MAKHLLLGTASENWRLPAEVDAEALLAELDSAAAESSVVAVTVEMNNDPRQRADLHVNPAVLGYWTVLEI